MRRAVPLEPLGSAPEMQDLQGSAPSGREAGHQPLLSTYSAPGISHVVKTIQGRDQGGSESDGPGRIPGLLLTNHGTGEGPSPPSTLASVNVKWG